MNSISDEVKEKMLHVMFIISRLNTIIKALDDLIYENDKFQKSDIENMFDILKDNFKDLQTNFQLFEKIFEID